MYRVRNVLKVTPEGWNGTIETVSRINELGKQRGWQQATVWTQTVGPFGELSIEIEYPDLATYERETAAYFADEEVMKLQLEAMRYLRSNDAGYSEMWQRAEAVAGPS